jgi:hypothetical protein
MGKEGKMPKFTREELFGTVKKASATGNFVADVESLLQPFERSISVMRVFCKGCGMLFEVTEKVANTMIDEDINKSGLYIEIQGCMECDGDKKQYEIKSIKDLLQ